MTSKILKLGAGGGARSKRLFERGYKVCSSDLIENNFRLKDKIPFMKVDLNLNFSEKFNDSYDEIVALELIEPLENVRNFFVNVKQYSNLVAI